jgi:hypothetical protein
VTAKKIHKEAWTNFGFEGYYRHRYVEVVESKGILCVVKLEHSIPPRPLLPSRFLFNKVKQGELLFYEPKADGSIGSSPDGRVDLASVHSMVRIYDQVGSSPFNQYNSYAKQQHQSQQIERKRSDVIRT